MPAPFWRVDVNPAAGVGSFPLELTPLADRLLWFGYDGSSLGLWSTDGTNLPQSLPLALPGTGVTLPVPIFPLANALVASLELQNPETLSIYDQFKGYLAETASTGSSIFLALESTTESQVFNNITYNKTTIYRYDPSQGPIVNGKPSGLISIAPTNYRRQNGFAENLIALNPGIILYQKDELGSGNSGLRAWDIRNAETIFRDLPFADSPQDGKVPASFSGDLDLSPAAVAQGGVNKPELFFLADREGGPNSIELWRTDGFEIHPVTELISDFKYQPTSFNSRRPDFQLVDPGIDDVVATKEDLYFSADVDNNAIREIWWINRDGGSFLPPEVVIEPAFQTGGRDINFPSFSAPVAAGKKAFTILNGSLNNPSTETEYYAGLYQLSDGILTKLAEYINPEPALLPSLSEAIAVGESLYYPSYDSSTEQPAIWRINPNGSEPSLVFKASTFKAATELTAVGNTLYFVAETSSADPAPQIWKVSNDEPQATTLGSTRWLNSGPRELTAFKDGLWFVANDGRGSAVWNTIGYQTPDEITSGGSGNRGTPITFPSKLELTDYIGRLLTALDQGVQPTTIKNVQSAGDGAQKYTPPKGSNGALIYNSINAIGPGKKDKIIDFNPELHAILIAGGLLGDSDGLVLKTGKSKKALKKFYRSNANVFFNPQKCQLFLNTNGADAGAGEGGGLLLTFDQCSQFNPLSLAVSRDIPVVSQ